MAVGIDPALHTQRYPELARLDEDPNQNHLWRNLVFQCDKFLHRNRGAERPLDNYVSAEDPGLADLAQGNLGLKPDAPILNRSAFRPIPFNEIGLYTDAWRKTLPPTERAPRNLPSR
jgi:hypothetical protein